LGAYETIFRYDKQSFEQADLPRDEINYQQHGDFAALLRKSEMIAVI